MVITKLSMKCISDESQENSKHQTRKEKRRVSLKLNPYVIVQFKTETGKVEILMERENKGKSTS